MSISPRGIRGRSPELVAGILTAIDDDDDPMPWPAIVDTFTDSGAYSWKTIEATIYDLIAFGAVHRIGRPARGRNASDRRALKLTPLGAAWLEGRVTDIPAPIRSHD